MKITAPPTAVAVSHAPAAAPAVGATGTGKTSPARDRAVRDGGDGPTPGLHEGIGRLGLDAPAASATGSAKRHVTFDEARNVTRTIPLDVSGEPVRPRYPAEKSRNAKPRTPDQIALRAAFAERAQALAREKGMIAARAGEPRTLQEANVIGDAQRDAAGLGGPKAWHELDLPGGLKR